MTQTVANRGETLIKLSDKKLTPLDNLVGFILSAYKDNSQELNLDYINKYKLAYTAFLSADAYALVEERIKKGNSETCPVPTVQSLRVLLADAGYKADPNGDLASLIERMVFTSSPTISTDEDPLSEVPEVDEDTKRTLNAVVESTLATLENLYQNVFSPLHPVGVYSFKGEDQGYSNGFIRHNTAHNKENLKNNLPGNDSKVTPTSSDALMHIKMICDRIGLSQLTDTGYVPPKELGTPNRHIYFSNQHGKLASGVIQNNKPSFKTWKKFKPPLRKWIEGHLGLVLKAYGNIDRNAPTEEQLAQTKKLNQVLSAASANLCNSVLVEVLDVKTAYLLVLKICAPALLGGESELRETINDYIDNLDSGTMALRNVSATKTSESSYPVYTITIALNSEIEAKAPMYAFQVWEDLESAGDLKELIGTHNIIFGRNSDGSLNAYNMKAPLNAKERHTAVVAGSGSGKGLTTLAAVASTAMNGQPVFYLDGKPDMAKAFWRYLASHPNPLYRGRAFAFDGVKSFETPVNISADPNKYAHHNSPEENPSMSDDALSGLVQLKAMSLMLALQEFTNSDNLTPQISELLGYDFTRGGLFVFDEIQKNTAQGLEPLLSFIRDWKPNTRKDADDDPKEQYRVKLKSFSDNVLRQIFGYHKALGRKSNISTFTIFQSLEYASNLNPKNAVDYGGFIGLRTLIGKIDAQEAKEVYMKTQTDSPIVDRAFKNFQWFDIKSGPVSAKASLSRRPSVEHHAPENPLHSPIKPFLLFNDEKNIIEYLEGVEHTLPNHVKELIAEEMARGDKNRLHTAGLLNYYGVDLADSLVLGYDIMQNFLRLAGFIGTVTDYVLSPHIDTLITSSQLVAQAQKTVATSPNLSLPEPLTPECIYTSAEAGTSVDYEANYDDDGDMSADFNYEDEDYEDYSPKPKNSPYKSGDFLAGAITTDEVLFGATPDPNLADYEYAPEQGIDDYETPEEQDNYEAPQEQQAPPQEQPKQQKQQPPYFYIHGTPFIQGKDGNFYHATGPYAPLHNVEPSTFRGQKWGDTPIIEQYGKSSPFSTNAQNINITDPSALNYADGFIGGEAVYRGKLRSMGPEVSSRRFEMAVSQRWYILMKAISKSLGGAKHVGHLRIGESIVYVNGRALAASSLILEGTGLRMSDIVDYPALFKEFKELRRLDIEKSAYTSFVSAYGKPSIPFTKHKRLMELNFEASDGTTRKYTREHAARDYDLPPDQLNNRFNTWSAMSAQVNKGKTSSFTKPGTRLIAADITKKMAAGVFGTKSSWTRKRKAIGFIGMLAAGAGTIVTGGIQAARASYRR